MSNQKYEFESYISKANSSGTGYLKIPNRFRDEFELNQQVKVKIENSGNKANFFGEIKNYSGKGLYVPKKLCKKINLIQKDCDIVLEKIDGFYKKVGSDGRIYLPNRLGKKLNLKRDNVIKIEVNFEDKNKVLLKPVRIRKKENTIEYFLMLGKKFGDKEGIFKILNVSKPNSKENKLKNDLDSILKDLNYIIDENTIHVFDGAKKQVKINKEINLKSLIYYLGAYLADGTKRDKDTWGICASTIRQARYYLKKHNEVIKDSKLSLSVSYTSLPGENIDKIKQIWEKNLDTEINSIRENKAEKDLEHRNKYGTLVIKEHKRLLPIIYNSLLRHFRNELTISKNKQLCWDFILGVLEGDGAPKAKERGHISITSNPEESEIIKDILNSINIKHKVNKRDENKVSIRIGALELFDNLEYIGKKLFCLYPKRRKKSIKRLANTGTGRFLLGKQDYVTNWVGKELREKNILNEDDEFTPKGNKIKKIFNEMYREIQEDSLPENEILLGE